MSEQPEDKYIRYNILELRSQHPKKFGRYIMALKNLINSDDWARICGIHGNTFNPHDKHVKCPTDPEVVTKIGATGEPYYCKHGVYSFIAWHSPYVYQYELLLNKHNKSKNRDYITLPWLELTDQSDDYSFINDPEITILYDSKFITTENPLSTAYYYVNGVRTRITRNGFLTPTNNKQYTQLMNVKKQLHQTLNATNYEEFSSTANKEVDYTPLEIPHNSLHNIIGGEGGNMSSIDIAGFDPLFWMHHCNMDRYYYQWYSTITDNFSKPLYPDLITEDTMNAPCAPFFKNNTYSVDPRHYEYGWKNCTGKYAQVSDILDINKFPYTYSELPMPLLQAGFNSYVLLKNVNIPPESLEINVYIHLAGEKLDRNKDFAGSAFWFGINQEEIHCARCKSIVTNFKIDIDNFVNEHNINSSNLPNYNILIEGRGLLIRDKENKGFKTYYEKDLVEEDNISIVIPSA